MKITRGLCLALALVASFALASCSSPEPSSEVTLQGIAERADRDISAQLAALGDDFSISVEGRGEDTLVLAITAEDAEDPEFTQLMVNLLSPASSLLLLNMEDAADIEDPIVVFEFFTADGRLVDSHELTMDTLADGISILDDVSPLDVVLQTHRVVAADLERDMAGLMTVAVELRGEGTIAYVFHIVEFFPEEGFDEDVVTNELLPELEGVFARLIPTMADMGIENPSIIAEFFNPDGTQLASTEVR